MIRLHLVGFTTDLKNLIFSRRKGAKSGTFVVSIDPRLVKTLEEVARLEKEAKAGKSHPEPDGSKRESKLTPREIQNLLRKGKTAQEVARLADTEVSWIQRFEAPILAERAGVVDAVKAGWISKPRLGRSAVRVGEAIAENLREKKVNVPLEILNEGWEAVLRDEGWEVRFGYLSRGQQREATFSYDPTSREVRPLNDLAREIAWRAADQEGSKAASSPGRDGRTRPKSKTARRPSGRARARRPRRRRGPGSGK